MTSYFNFIQKRSIILIGFVLHITEKKIFCKPSADVMPVVNLLIILAQLYSPNKQFFSQLNKHPNQFFLGSFESE